MLCRIVLVGGPELAAAQPQLVIVFWYGAQADRPGGEWDQTVAAVKVKVSQGYST